jgi:UDP-glucose 4-epimerase
LNILITGGAGFVGSNLAIELLNQNHNVVIVDDLYTGREKNIPKEAIFYKMDIRDSTLMGIFEKHDINFVSHQAARGDVRGSLVNPLEYADVNITGGINLLECCVKQKVSGITFASSGGCVYGEPKNIPTSEDHIMQPLDPYGATKAAFEIYIATYHRLYNLNYTIFRYPNVYGPRQNPYGENGVISIIGKLMLQNKNVTINGDGKNIRDFVYIDDVVYANILSINNILNDSFNVGTGIGTNINDIVEKLASITGFKGKIKHGEGKKGEISRSVLDNSKINKFLGWTPTTTLFHGLKNTIEYLKND